MSKRLVLTLALVVAASLVLAEVLLRPASGDRLHLLVILAIPAVVAVAATPMLSRWVSRRASVAGAVLAVALCSLTLGAATSSAASNAMFVSSHDFRLFVVVLLLSSGIALVVGSQLSRPLARDIQRLEHVAERVAAGDLTVRSGIDRHDEVGATARAVDAMVLTLADMERERAMLTEARRHLFTSIGHDLRTPLSAMRAAVESLEDGVAPDPQRYFGIISAQLTTVDTLLDQLIEFARLESGHASTVRERLSVAELADESAEALAPLADEVELGDRSNMVFTGTAATYGHGRAIVTTTGMRTEMGRIAGLLRRTGRETTPLQRELDRTGRILGITAVAQHAGDIAAAGVYILEAGMTTDQVANLWSPYLTMAEGLKLTAQTFTTDITKLSCCAA